MKGEDPMIRDISVAVYKMRFGVRDTIRMLAKDNDGGVKLRERAGSYDALTRCYLAVFQKENVQGRDTFKVAQLHYCGRRAFFEAFAGSRQFDKNQIAELLLSVLRDADDRDIAVDAKPFMICREPQHSGITPD